MGEGQFVLPVMMPSVSICQMVSCNTDVCFNETGASGFALGKTVTM